MWRKVLQFAAASFASLLVASVPRAAETPGQEAIENLNLRIGGMAANRVAIAAESPERVVPRLLRFSNGRRIGYLHPDGRVAVAPSFDAASEFFDGKLAVRMEGKWGFIDHRGQVLIEPKYQDLSRIWWLPLQAKVAGQWGILDQDGRWIAQPAYDEMRRDGDLFLVRQDKRTGAIDLAGRQVLPPVFSAISVSGDQREPIVVEIGRRYGVLDRRGNSIVEPTYDRLSVFAWGHAVARKGHLQGLIDASGNVVLPVEYDFVSHTFRGDRWIVRKGNRYGVVSPAGVPIIPVEYRSIGSNGPQHLTVSNGAGHALADMDGKFLTAFAFQQINYFREGLAPAQVEGKWGYLNELGEIAIATRFDVARGFSQGLAPVSIGGAFGYIDRTGAVAIPMRFEDAYGFLPDGIAAARSGGRFAYVDRTGARIADVLQFDVESVSGYAFKP